MKTRATKFLRASRKQICSRRPKGIGSAIIGLRLARLVAIFVCVAVFPNAPGAEPAPNSDGQGAYATGKYRNLFVEIGKSPVEIREKIEAAFQQLFHGDPASQTVYYKAGTRA